MVSTDINQTTYSDLSGTVKNYSVGAKITDGINPVGETYWDSPYFSKWYSYYKKHPRLKAAINALATWTLGQGYETDPLTKSILDFIKGWGEDTFLSVLWNMLVTKKINGDAFAEIITLDGTLLSEKGKIINLKPLDPMSIRIVCNPQGKIIRYEQLSKANGAITKKFKPEEIFHLCNDRIVDNIHGESIIEACQWDLDAIREAEEDWRRISHRSTIRVLYIEEDNATRLAAMKQNYADAIKKGELLILPCKAGEAQFADLTLPPVEQFLAWIRYREDAFYQSLGVPKVILGGTAENTEASSKVGMITFEPTFTREIKELEMDIYNQLGIKIVINKQPSLMDNMYSDEQKNTGQTNIQPNDVNAGSGE